MTLVSGPAWTRLLALPQVWTHPDELAAFTGRLVSMLSMSGRFAWRLRGLKNGEVCWSLGTVEVLHAWTALAGAFPGAQVRAVSLEERRYVHRVSLVGVPGSMTPGGQPQLRLDPLYRAMAALGEWEIAVDAVPLEGVALQRALMTARQTLSAALSRQEGAGLHRPAEVRAEVALAEETVLRLERALQGGGWEVAVTLGADAPPTLGVLSSQLRAALRWNLPGVDALREALPGGVTLLPSDDLAGYLQPPGEAQAGLEVFPDARFGTGAGETSVPGVRLGTLLDRGADTGRTLSLPLDALTRHALVCGATGWGKSTATRRLLHGAAAQGVPFLVIEPAKPEYARSFPEALVVTPGGGEGRAPLRLDPFAVVPGARIGTHVDRLAALFVAAFGLFTPIDLYLRQALDAVYAGHGWRVAKDCADLDSGRRFPTLSEVKDACEDAIARAGYGAGVGGDLRAALLGRLSVLGSGTRREVFGAGEATPDEALFGAPCVVDLAPLGDDADKVFAMGVLCLRLLARHEARPESERFTSRLRHLLVVEEAHRLLRAAPPGQAGQADPRSQATESFGQLLSEARAYGQALVLVEQRPSLLLPAAIANTATTLAFRLRDAADRSAISGALALDESQAQALTRLRVGEAVVSTPHTDQPVHVRIDG